MLGEVGTVQILLAKVPTGEDAHAQTRAGGGEDLLASHRVPQSLARVLARPDGCETRSTGLASIDLVSHRCWATGDYFLEPDWIGGRFKNYHLAEEVVLVGGGERGVCVGRTNHAELEGIHAELVLVGKSTLQRLACVLAREHVGRLHLSAEAPFVPALEVGEFVGGREDADEFRHRP